jgi:predicted nucleic acid-binding protein
MLIYADGGALAHVLGTQSESVSWVRFASEAGDRLATSPLGLTELRRAADPLGSRAREVAREVADQITVLRFSDQAVKAAARASVAVPPFTAIHAGIAVAHPDVDTIATYDVVLARLAVIYGLRVVSPGREDGWWEG